jgi:carnitine-CoA ligase
VPRSGAAVDAAELRDWAERRLARHMVPRYVQIAERIPRTPTEKIAKHLLIAQGVTPGTVDFDPPRPPATES